MLTLKMTGRAATSSTVSHGHKETALLRNPGCIFSLHILSSLQVSEEAERLGLSQTQTKKLVKKLRLRLLSYVSGSS